jgi:hypothetical protein
LSEGDRRRVPLDPASKIIDSLAVGHPYQGTMTEIGDEVPVRPRLSVTRNVTG